MEIRGTRIVLRDEWRSSDDEDRFRWRNLEEWNYYDEPDKPLEGMDREEYERRLQERRRNPRMTAPSSHSWQIDTSEGRHIGWVNYYGLDEQAKRVYVGICLPEEETWGEGYGTETVTLLLSHLFNRMGLEEVRTATWTGNKRMMRCAEKSGFGQAVRMPHRASVSVRGEPLERVEFSVSREKWSDKADSG
jgi:RimJ/RimL family protein N-acetyltransferase